MKVDNVTFYAFSLHLDSDFSLKLRIHLGTFIYFLLIFQLALSAMDFLLDCHVLPEGSSLGDQHASHREDKEHHMLHTNLTQSSYGYPKLR